MQEAVLKRLKSLGLDDASSDEDTPSRKEKKLKSGRKRTAADLAKVPVEWPHFHTFRGPGRDAPKYDELTICEFVHGYATIMLDGTSQSADHKYQLRHLKELMMDASDHGWEAARNAHGVVLQQMETGKLAWDNGDKITEITHTYSRRHSNSLSARNSSRVSQPEQSNGGRGLLFCIPFQEGSCTIHATEHASPRGTVRHICAYCVRTTNRAYPHAEANCIRKHRHSLPKNWGPQLTHQDHGQQGQH